MYLSEQLSNDPDGGNCKSRQDWDVQHEILTLVQEKVQRCILFVEQEDIGQTIRSFACLFFANILENLKHSAAAKLGVVNARVGFPLNEAEVTFPVHFFGPEQFHFINITRARSDIT